MRDTILPQYVFMAWYLVKHWNNFTFYRYRPYVSFKDFKYQLQVTMPILSHVIYKPDANICNEMS